jgi:hypothetical protein
METTHLVEDPGNTRNAGTGLPGTVNYKKADIARLMSIFPTLKQWIGNSISTVPETLKQYIQTGNIPPLPSKEHLSEVVRFFY